MSEPLLIIAFLAAATFATRFLGVVLGQHLPDSGPWARALNALPGCLIVSLVAVMLVDGSMPELIGAAAALGVAAFTRNLPLTMIASILVVWLLRSYA